jgi:hypothetical protein
MIKLLSRLFMVGLVLIWCHTSDAQRKTFYIDTDFPEMTHANGTKTLAEAGITGSTKYPNAFRWWTIILAQPAATFQNLTVASAVLNEAHYAGNGAGFALGTQSTSRNNVERIPGGVYMVNVGITVLQGRFIGGGTSIGLNGNASTELVYDHARWMDPRPIRAVIISANWGTSTYLESIYISDVRVNGRGPHWKDNSYDQHGIALQIMGETAAIGRVYVENCNGHGVWVNGAGPGRIEHLTTFDNALAGLYATSEKSGGTNGNSLGFLEIQHISGDNNAWVVLNRQGPAMSIGYLKNEDGLSAQRGRPKKGQVCIEAWGWVNIYAAQVTHAINGASGPAFVVNSTANKSRLRVEQYSAVANNANVDQGSSALLMDLRSKQVWRPANQNAQDVTVMDFTWTALGTASTFTCSEPMGVISHNFTTRPGLATTYAGYNYAAGMPVWDATGGTVVTPPTPTPCTFTYGAWSACVNGQQTRFATASPTGCVGSAPLDSLSRSCQVTPPPSTASGINPADVCVVVNTNDPTSAAMATAYMTAWGIPLANLVNVSLGTGEDLTNATTLNTARTAINAKGRQFTVLAFSVPSRYAGQQSITSAITFGNRSVSNMTVSSLYNYTGMMPRSDKGVAPAVLLRSANYIRKDAHGTRPTGTGYLVLANDQHTACATNCGSVNCSPRGKARRGQTATGLVVWDNVCTSVQGGNNACNSLSTSCWLKDNGVPRTITPVIANYGSGAGQCCDEGVIWRKGYYGDHVTSTGGTLPTGAGQTPLTYHLDRGASMTAGTVVEPWQDRSGNSPGSLVEQFVDVRIFHPLFVGGSPVGVAAWAAVKCPDRTLFVGDLMCSPFAR